MYVQGNKGRDLNIICMEIEQVRGVLNSIVDDMKTSKEEVLRVSEKLDILINEYLGKNLDVYKTTF